MTDTTISNPMLRRIVHSKYIDVLGVVLVVGITLYRNFHETIYYEGGIRFGIPFSSLWSYIEKGAFPIGILSILGAVFSLLATRFLVRQSNIGNVIWIFTTINSGVIDYLFGNHSAIITYPLTFGLALLSTKKWYEGERIKNADFRYWILFIVAFIISYSLVYLGFYWFGTTITNPIFKHTIAIIFGISIIGNVGIVFKYKQSFLVWTFYNFAQIVKNFIQGNLANVIKYVFYLSNAILTYFDWHLNGDVQNIKEK